MLSGREQPELFCSLPNAPLFILQRDIPRVFSGAAEAPCIFLPAESPCVLSQGSGICVFCQGERESQRFKQSGGSARAVLLSAAPSFPLHTGGTIKETPEGFEQRMNGPEYPKVEQISSRSEFGPSHPPDVCLARVHGVVIVSSLPESAVKSQRARPSDEEQVEP